MAMLFVMEPFEWSKLQKSRGIPRHIFNHISLDPPVIYLQSVLSLRGLSKPRLHVAGNSFSSLLATSADASFWDLWGEARSLSHERAMWNLMRPSKQSVICIPKALSNFSVPLEFRGLLCFASPQLYIEMCWIASNLIERKGQENGGKRKERREERKKTGGGKEGGRRGKGRTTQGKQIDKETSWTKNMEQPLKNTWKA